MARNKFATVKIDEDAGAVNFSFTNGTGRSVVIDTLSPNVRSYAALHGLKQRLGDSYAGVDTVEEAIAEFDKVNEVLASGAWKTRGEGEPQVGAMARFIIAYAAAKGQTVTNEQAQAKIKSFSDEQKRAVKSSSAYVEWAAAEARKKAKDVNVEELLAV